MDAHIRIVVKQHFGIQLPPNLAINANSTEAWKRAKSRPDGVTGLALYGSTSGGSSDGNRQPAIGLAHFVVYDSTYNTLNQWTPELIGNPAWLEQISNPFNDYKPGLNYFYSGIALALTGARFASVFNILENEAFSVKFFLPKPPRLNEHHLAAWQCGTAAGGGYRLEILDGKFQLCQLARTWNRTDQDTLDAARTVGGVVGSVAQMAINTLMASQFAEVFPLDGNEIGIDAENLYNRAVEIKWFAEPRGRVHIQVTGAGEATVENAAILATGTAGTLWAAAPLTYSVNRGATFWQRGTVVFRTTGRLAQPAFRWFYFDPPSTLGVIHNGQQHAPGGTSIAWHFNESNSLFPFLYADFSGDGSNTPWAYTIASSAPGGERALPDGVDPESTYWDSDVANATLAALDPNPPAPGQPPRTYVEILKLEPTCEGETRRFSLHVEIGNPDNVLGLAEGGLDFGDRLMDVYLDGVLWLGNLKISNASVSPVAAAHRDAAGGDFAPVLRPESIIEFDAHDLWYQAERNKMRDDPVMDGLVLGEALYRAWQGLGLSAAQLAGIDRTAGPPIDSAALGECPKARPQRGVPRADFIRFLLEEFGRGEWAMHVYTGVVTLYQTSGATSIYTFLPGELEEIELLKDNRDVSNNFPVEGAGGLAASWTIHQSFRAPTWEGYIGELVTADTLQNEGYRTLGEAQLAGRARSRHDGKPGLFLSAKTSFRVAVLPGRIVTISGRDYRIERVNPGELAAGRGMDFSARRIVALP